MLSTTRILTIARNHLSSVARGEEAHDAACFYLTEAENLFVRSSLGYAREWALRSLAHSVGVFHPDYRAVAESVLANRKAVRV